MRETEMFNKATTLDVELEREGVLNNNHSRQANIDNTLNNIPKILMYHRVVADISLSENQATCVHVNEFHKQLEFIEKMGYTPITFDDYRLFQEGEIQLPRKPIIITFDDGYLDTYRHAFPLLEEYGMKAVIFVVGDQSVKSNVWDNEESEISSAPLMNREQILELYKHGFEIGVHTFSHSNLVHLPQDKWLHEIKRPKVVLEALTGEEINSFAYPYGQVNQLIKEYVVESGYRYACGVFSGPARFGEDLFEIRRLAITNKTSIVGFAFRLTCPYEYLEWTWWKYHKRNNAMMIKNGAN